jgi:hypothetical protein
MKRRFVLTLAIACAIVLQVAATRAAAQDSPQTVKAAIPPQTQQATAPAPANVPQARPTPAAVAQPAVAAAPVSMPPQARPAVAQPQVAAPRVEPAPAPKLVSDTEAANVKVEVTITYQVGNAAPVKRMATLTVADQGRGSLRSGNQIAVPSTTYQPLAPAKSDGGVPAPAAPLTSFNYKSVGLNLDARAVYIQGNKAKLDLSVEFSAVDEKTSDGAGRPPSFPTFSQNMTLVLENGRPLVVGQSSDFVDNVERKQTVEVKATILR